MPRLFHIISCCFTLLATAIATNSQTQRPAASQQKAATETVRAIAPPRQPLPPEVASANVTRFSFILAFDSNIATDDKQYEWIKSQLEGLDRRRYVNVIAFCHHPPFSSGPHGGVNVEPPAAALRLRYLPLFRAHHVKALFTGHEHFFEHWVERYADSTGRQYRMDQVVTGGGGAPLYSFQGAPDLRDYLTENEAGKVNLEHLVKPGPQPGDNAYHYVVMQVDEERLKMEVIGVDWGFNFRPYRSNKIDLDDSEVLRQN